MLRQSVHAALDFGGFLEQLGDTETIGPEVERVARQILWGARQFAGVRAAAEGHVELGPYEEVEFANESTLGHAESYARLQELAASIAREKRPISLRWAIYATVVDLREEYRERSGVLAESESALPARLDALLHLLRLQLVFLANTFW